MVDRGLRIEDEESVGETGTVDFVRASDLPSTIFDLLSALRAFDAETAEGVGQILEGVVEFVADVADGEAGALADLVVFEVFVVFEGNELAVGGIEFGDEELEGADGFEVAEGLVGIGRVAGEFMDEFGVDFALVVAEVVEGEVADGTKEPGAGVGDVFPVGVEFEKGFLDEVFGGLPLADEAAGVAEQRGFLRFEDLPECRFFLHGVSKRDHRIASGISPRRGAGGLGFHE
jgi:hypothetical protein